MKKTIEKYLVTYEFEDHQDVVNFIDTYPNGKWHNASSHQAESGTRFHKYTWEDTLEHFKSGWIEGVAEVDKLAESIKTKLTENIDQYTVSYDVTGDFIDMGRYVDGTPECMGYVDLIPQPMESLSIVINIGARASVNVEDIYRRGAAITSLIDELQKQFFITVKLVQYSADCAGKPKNFKQVFNLNMKNEYSRDLLAFYVAHPGMMRRICFAIKEMHFDSQVFCSSNYGYSHNIEIDKTKCLYFPRIDSYDAQWKSADTAANEVKEILARYNKKED